MDAKLFRRFDDIPWPERSELKFVSEIREFEPPAAVPVKKIYFDTPELLPPAAGASLQRHFIIDQNGHPLTSRRNVVGQVYDVIVSAHALCPSTC